jgi:hypothetical protein
VYGQFYYFAKGGEMSMDKTKIVVDVDFCSDWANLLRNELDLMGCPAENNDSPFDVCVKYYNSLLRQPTVRPRIILKSREFTCPADHQAGLIVLEDKVKNGQDISPYLHNKLSNSAYNDGLLNDWGIHHFHIGEIGKQSGKVSRTGPLLYALVKDDHFYMIDVMSHKDFSKQRLIEIIYSNWPDVIEGYEVEGALGLDYVCNDEDVRRLRDNGISTLTMRSDGAVHLPVGGGITTSGTSVEVARQSTRCMKILKMAEHLLKRDTDEIRQKAISAGYVVGNRFEFALKIHEGLFYGVERLSGFEVHLPDLEKILCIRRR